MKRIAVAVAVLAVVGMAAPAGAAPNHLGASNNVSLSRQWSASLFPLGAATAIVVRSDGFADSLAAGALAGALNAPVLMNPPGGGLDSAIATELDRLGVETVLVIGGTAAVSDQAIAEMGAEGYDVARVAGPNRVATAAAVMARPQYDDASVVYLARAFGDGSSAFADSLGAGMLAGSEGAPLALSETEVLSVETRNALDDHPSVERVVLVGGTAALSPAVETELEFMGLVVDRIAGATRFETAARIADLSFDAARSRVVAIVDGFHANSWASGFPASAAAGGAVLLSEDNELAEETVSFLSSQDGGSVYCAPEVPHDPCVAADDLLNG